MGEEASELRSKCFQIESVLNKDQLAGLAHSRQEATVKVKKGEEDGDRGRVAQG